MSNSTTLTSVTLVAASTAALSVTASASASVPGPLGPKVVDQSRRLWELTIKRKRLDLETLLKDLEQKRKRQKRHGNSTSSAADPILSLQKAVEYSDSDKFKDAVDRIARGYSEKKAPQMVEKYIYPHLDHLKSFKHAIATATQAEPTGTASLVWGLLYVVIQCTCVFAESVELIMEQIQSFHDLLSSISKDVDMYPNSTDLGEKLGKILELYFDFCIAVVRHFSRNPAWNFVRTLISSSLQRDLKKVTARLDVLVKTFDQYAHREGRGTTKEVLNNVLGMREELRKAPQSPPAATAKQVKFPVHSVNIVENPEFFGREAELDKLQQLLIDQHTDAKPAACSLYGNPGVGKTQIALKFVYKHRDKFDAVFWVSADPKYAIETLRTFGNIGRRLGLFTGETIEDNHVEIVLEWLQTAEQRWLLIFDNVVDYKSVARYWPTTSLRPSAIIATTQKANTRWIHASHQINVEFLDDSAGADLLCELYCQQMQVPPQTISPDDRKTAAQISHELGGSPLYLTQAQGVITTSNTALPEYLELIKSRSSLPGNMIEQGGSYPNAVGATHDRLIEELDTGAVKLLYMLSFMNPEHISEDLLTGGHNGEACLDFLNDEATYIDYVSQLGQCRLAQRDGTGTNQRYLAMHRSNRKAMLIRLDEHPEERQATLDRVVRLLRSQFPSPSPLQIANQEVWPRLPRILPHVISAVHAFERAWPRMSGSMFFAKLISDVGGIDLYDRGLISEAYKLNCVVESMLDSLQYPLDTPLRGDALTILGLCTDNMAITKRREGLAIRRKCLDIRQRCFKAIPADKLERDDKIRLYNSYTDLVCSQQQVNDFQGVQDNLALCLEQYRIWGPEDDITLAYEYAKYYNQMAYVLLWDNRGDEAVAFADRAYALIEQASPGTGISRLYQSDYAHILFQNGERNEARCILETLGEISEKECGKDNLRTLEISLNVAIMDFLMGDFDSARHRLENTITIGERISGWPRENTVRGRYYLSQVLLQQARVKNSLSDSVDGLKMEEASLKDLDELLMLDDSDMATTHRGDLPMLFDYLVHWENRLVTPRKAIAPAAAVGVAACDVQTNATNVVDIKVATVVHQNQGAFASNMTQQLTVQIRGAENLKQVKLPVSSSALDVGSIPVHEKVPMAEPL